MVKILSIKPKRPVPQGYNRAADLIAQFLSNGPGGGVGLDQWQNILYLPCFAFNLQSTKWSKYTETAGRYDFVITADHSH